MAFTSAPARALSGSLCTSMVRFAGFATQHEDAVRQLRLPNRVDVRVVGQPRGAADGAERALAVVHAALVTVNARLMRCADRNYICPAPRSPSPSRAQRPAAPPRSHTLPTVDSNSSRMSICATRGTACVCARRVTLPSVVWRVRYAPAYLLNVQPIDDSHCGLWLWRESPLAPG